MSNIFSAVVTWIFSLCLKNPNSASPNPTISLLQHNPPNASFSQILFSCFGFLYAKNQLNISKIVHALCHCPLLTTKLSYMRFTRIWNARSNIEAGYTDNTYAFKWQTDLTYIPWPRVAREYIWLKYYFSEVGFVMEWNADPGGCLKVYILCQDVNKMRIFTSMR